MNTLARAVFGFCLISVVYIAVTLMGLSMLAMSHCILSDAQIAVGATCTKPADQFFWPAVIAAAFGFVVIQWAFLRRELRKKP